jgi:hypothetical protein
MIDISLNLIASPDKNNECIEKRVEFFTVWADALSCWKKRRDFPCNRLAVQKLCRNLCNVIPVALIAHDIPTWKRVISLHS